ncbi:MAG: creatininase family protein, partial [Gemmatimonadota bacterium]|nr:creatininase family protein [Gemmatimonadota bacterium]
SLSVDTYVRLMGDILDNLARMGGRRILLVNGHGGNAPGGAFAVEWAARNPGCRVKLHNWWQAPKTLAKLREIDPLGSHASWAENFPWTRIPGVEPAAEASPAVDRDRMSVMSPEEVRDYLGAGNMGGLAMRPDEDVLALWSVGVKETREQLEGPWGP